MKINNKDILKKLPDAIFIDIDNTLYFYDLPHEKALKSVSEYLCNTHSLKQKEFNTLYTKARLKIKSQLGATASSHSRILYFQAIIESMGLGSQLKIALELEQLYWSTFLVEAKLFPLAQKFLSTAKYLDIPIVAITDLTANIQYRKIIFFELENYFNYVVTSEESGRDKPDKKIFEIAIGKLNSKNNVIWMIGDDVKKDIYGAKSINAFTIQKVHNGIFPGVGKNKPDAWFKNYSDLVRMINKLK